MQAGKSYGVTRMRPGKTGWSSGCRVRQNARRASGSGKEALRGGRGRPISRGGHARRSCACRSCACRPCFCRPCFCRLCAPPSCLRPARHHECARDKDACGTRTAKEPSQRQDMARPVSLAGTSPYPGFGNGQTSTRIAPFAVRSPCSRPCSRSCAGLAFLRTPSEPVCGFRAACFGKQDLLPAGSGMRRRGEAMRLTPEGGFSACVPARSSWPAPSARRHSLAPPSDSWARGPTSRDIAPASGRNASSGDASAT